ncbi:hypothetical protein Ait01nite_020300 [Actinoplanes italicus]|uniref:Uncharacterized protein n=1 Tax=Actinoplanes italicus TaxID=113567 RepID=A0A2T0KPA1_9ACTN|nr:hypothetical protein [Actinoplanes italicus]PRX25571.1 hypothetical protein CLV67_101288 [Actinoplanes italicus]GIE28985.1 hypothetical protein Ait01nite_020300 [Actinoplanes italicus]
MEQDITFGTAVSVRVLVAMPGQARGQVLIVEWGPNVALLVQLGRYELVEVMSVKPELTVPAPQPPQEPQPEDEPAPAPHPGPDPIPAEGAAGPPVAASARRKSRP